jgi:hypothetical protein
MLFYIFFSAFIIYGVCGRDIRLYFWNKKSPEEKYVAWRKARADYNHENGIVDEFQYDYIRHSTEDAHQSIQAP